MLGDLIFAEPKALIGFAGRRVIEQTLQEQLPDDFQTAEYVLHHGLLDLIVPRSFLKQALSETITLYKEAPLKVRGTMPYGQRGPLTKVREEQLRRFAKSSQDSKYQDFIAEFDQLLEIIDTSGTSALIKQTDILEKAIQLASQPKSQTSWLNPPSKEFQVRSTFGSSNS